jgi:hypothetical protein
MVKPKYFKEFQNNDAIVLLLSSLNITFMYLKNLKLPKIMCLIYKL